MRLLSVVTISLALSAAGLAQSTSKAGTQAPSHVQSESAPAPPEHPITKEQTRQMFALMSFDKMVDRMMQQMIDVQTEQAPFIPSTVWDDFRSSFQKTDFVAVFLPVYQKYLSEEDAQKSLEFYQTPAGQRMLKAMPPMMAEVSTLGAEKGQEIARAVLDRHMEEIKAAEKKYEEQKPSTPGTGPQVDGP